MRIIMIRDFCPTMSLCPQCNSTVGAALVGILKSPLHDSDSNSSGETFLFS